MNNAGTQFGDAKLFAFRDQPIYHEKARYDAARDAYIERVRNLKGVVSIYQMGGVSAPGISDLDLIVVMENDVTPPDAVHFGTSMMTEAQRYIFFHPGAMVTRREVFPRLGLLTYAANLEHRWGEHIAIQAQDNPHWIDCANLIDQSTHLLHALTKSAVSKVIYIRRMIMALSSIGHTIALARSIGLDIEPAWETHRDEVQLLKVNWFDNPGRDTLVAYADRARPIVLEVLSRLARKMVAEGLLQEVGHDISPVHFFPSINAFTVFDQQPLDRACWGVRGVSIKIGQNYMSTTLSVVTLPREFAAHVAAYTNGKTVLSSRLATCLGEGAFAAVPGGDANRAYQELLQDRVELWGKNLGDLAEHGLMAFDVMPFFGARLTYGGGNGLKGRLNGLRDKVVMGYNRRAFRKAVSQSGVRSEA